MKILVLPGDGIGPEIINQALLVLDRIRAGGFECEVVKMPIGGAGYDAFGDPLPESTLEEARDSQAILLGAVGGPQYDSLPRHHRPEQGLLRIRKELQLFANLRPAVVYKELLEASAMKPFAVEGLDLMILRELTGDIYFGQPRGRRVNKQGDKEGYDTMVYSESEVRRIAKVAFQIAQKRAFKVCSVDKANVLDTSILWREVVTDIGKEYPDVELSHMYVDNAAMQLVREPKQFDVILTGNIFGDILSDQAAMLTGSIGMLPSASLNKTGVGLFEPVHGSAPDIAHSDQANPLATILSLAMLLRYSANRGDLASKIETAVKKVLAGGYRTIDIKQDGAEIIGTIQMGELVCQEL